MAIDTIPKKLSLMDFDEVMQAAVPYPDGSIDQGDKQHGLWSYSGLLATTPVAPVEQMDASFIQQSHFIRESATPRHHEPDRGSHVGARLLPFWRLPAFPVFPQGA